MAFCAYPARQGAADKIENDGGTAGAVRASQMALAFASRFGPTAVFFAIVFFGCVPSGASEQKPEEDAWHPQMLRGGESALARAVHRGDGPVVLAMLHHAPNMQMGGGFWQQMPDGIGRSRIRLKAWAEERGRSA